MSDDYSSILVADFGEAFITQEDSTTFAAGTLSYMAPERFSNHPTSKSDLWSCGIIIYEMIHLKVPFANQEEILKKNEIHFRDTEISKQLKPLLVEYEIIYIF